MFYILLILLYSTSLPHEGEIERTKSNLFVMGITYSFQSETNEKLLETFDKKYRNLYWKHSYKETL